MAGGRGPRLQAAQGVRAHRTGKLGRSAGPHGRLRHGAGVSGRDFTPDFESDAFRLRKHSVLLDGHQTSITLEDAFWDQLNAIARRQGVSLNRLVTDIDHARTTNLSSALRVFVLEFLRAETP
ncbi:MAG: ribbon-helix-helix domain-containing protein [Alphaproteobacteria bacterium]|nr:ribbon-helix-helix domain-containing protein [Alphaproteobacteria bacterium]